MSGDRRYDEVLERIRDAYNPPPETPRAEMWKALEAELAARRDGSAGSDVVPLDPARRRARRVPRRVVAGLSVAAAALLLLGIGIGRVTAPAGPAGQGGPALSTGEAGLDGASPVRVAAARHLVESEALLALVRADARAGRVDGQVGSWGRSLLVETRLLLDSSAGDDPTLRRLLEDLELVLAQVTLLAETGRNDRERSARELMLIDEGMERQNVIGRIQAAIPAYESGS